jgi:hypothetical protein
MYLDTASISLSKPVNKLSKSPTKDRIQLAHLSPCNVRRDKEFNVSVAENAQDRAPKVPVCQAAPSFEQFRGDLLLARLVFAPRKDAVATCVLLFDIALHMSGTLVRSKARKDKYGLMRNFSSVRRSPSIHVVTARGSPPIAARSGSCDGGLS